MVHGVTFLRVRRLVLTTVFLGAVLLVVALNRGRPDERGDVVDPGIERGRVMDEIDPCLVRHVAEGKARRGGSGSAPLFRSPAIQRDDQEDRAEKHRRESEPPHA